MVTVWVPEPSSMKSRDADGPVRLSIREQSAEQSGLQTAGGLARVFINPPSIQKWLTQSSEKNKKKQGKLWHSNDPASFIARNKELKNTKAGQGLVQKNLVSYNFPLPFYQHLCGSKARILKYFFKTTHRDVGSESSWVDADLCGQFSPEDGDALKWLLTFGCSQWYQLLSRRTRFPLNPAHL